MTLFTIGYGKYRSLESLLAAIPPETLIIDVRRNAFCGWNAEFCQQQLTKALGWQYQHDARLGNQQHGLPFMPHPHLKDAIDALETLIRQGATLCLLCQEPLAKDCHRTSIAARLRARVWELQVVDL